MPPNRSSRWLGSIFNRAQEFQNVVQAASGQGEVLRMVFGAVDDARFIVGREPHGLRAIKLRILKRRQPNQSVADSRRQSLLTNVNLIANDQLQGFGQAAFDGAILSDSGWWSSPR